MAATFLMTLWDVLARALTLIGEAVVAVLFFLESHLKHFRS